MYWQDSTHLRARRSQGSRIQVLHDPGKQFFALGPTSEETQEWTARNFLDFISVDLSPHRPGHWPAIPFDLDALYYSIWGILDSIACAKPHWPVEALKRDLTKAWNNLLMDIIARAVDDFPRRLKKWVLMRSVRHFCEEVCQHPELYFSGIQPTGVPHLGNYFGFIEPWIQLQNSLPPTTKMILAIADQHALSLGPKPSDESIML
ncbi:hypothetical protein ANCDUO_12569 [Ancylostoma duodenale]|uniref:Tryptophan--tRNA ligase n=1 Tax=Ancylostoma duodenale TaxID=51022 RepID=A0A0C2G8C9_9BILA|nr:hypothetical protein ANCDUO_12569 [Ancylostoma duodenale]